MPTIKRLGVLTGGGDAPGLNAVIRAVVKAATGRGVECLGLEDSFDGLLEANRSRVLTPRDVTGILRLGGTILGTLNHGNPFDSLVDTSDGPRAYGERVVEMFHRMKLDALVTIGGDGTLAISHQFCRLGIPIVGVPKTIDNDIVGTTNCFGFDTAVAFATDAIDRLHTTAEAHHRIMVVEVMGRYAGWIALYAGVAGGADAILIPEVPFDLAIVAERLRARDRLGAKFSIVVVAEGAFAKGGKISLVEAASDAHVERLGGIGAQVCAALGRAGREGSPVRRARAPAARRRADQLRSAARDALRRPGGRAGDGRRVRHHGRLRSPRHRRAAPRGSGGEDEDRAARFRSHADSEGAGRHVRRLTGAGRAGGAGGESDRRQVSSGDKSVCEDGHVVRARLAARSTLAGGRLGRAGTSARSCRGGPCAWRSRRARCPKGHCARADILECDDRGRVVGRRGGKPSAETLLHIEIARLRGAGAVLHTHSVWSTMLSGQTLTGRAGRARQEGPGGSGGQAAIGD